MYLYWTQNRIPKQALQYKLNLLQHVQRMDTNRLPKQALQYKILWLQHVQSVDKTGSQNKNYHINKCG